MTASAIGRRVSYALRWAVLTAGTLVMLFPMIFMIMVGFFTKEEYWSTDLSLFPVAKKPTLLNYLALFDAKYMTDIFKPFINTLTFTVATTAVCVVTILFCAYAFSRLRWRGQYVMFFTILATTMMPGTMGLIPKYIMYSQLGVINTMWVYYISLPGINIMGTFVTMQFFRTIPYSLDESAKIDGANIFQIMFRIILPVAKPIFGYIIITTAIGAWNNWQTGFFFTDRVELRTLSAALSALAIVGGAGQGTPNYPFIVTLSLLITLPSMIIYVIFQKYIVQGLAAAGMKE